VACRHLDEQRCSISEVQVHGLPGNARPLGYSGERQALDPTLVGFLPSGIEEARVSCRIGHGTFSPEHLTRVNRTSFTRVKQSSRERGMIWTSEIEPIVIDDTTVGDAVGRAARGYSSRLALIDGPSGRAVSHGELARRIGRIAGWLYADGLRPGHCVATWAPNLAPVAACTLATMTLGASVTCVNPAWTDDEVQAQLGDADARVVVTIPDLADRARSFGVRRVIVLGEAAPWAVPIAALLAGHADAPRFDVDCDSVALLPYSSGTTGLPKGVMLSHRQLVTVSRQIARALSVDDHDVTLAVAPWFHILGFTAELLVPLMAGATIVTTPRFDPATFLDLLERHRVTYLAGPPPLVSFLAEHPHLHDHDLSHLELIGSGGAPLPATTHDALVRRLPRSAVGQGWGLTETSGAICIPTRPAGTAPGTVGPLLPNTELRVVDPTSGAELGPGVDGELQARGPQTMLGYLHRPNETADMITGDGWVRTGDLGHVDNDGTVVVVDRLKDLIKVNGFQVAPAEVEAALVQHPVIVDAAVVGRPDERRGQVPVAYIVANASVSVDELAEWITPRLAPYKHPAEYRQVEQLPRTPSGKLLRRHLDHPVVAER
jgi:acyl-CoA synthetase (AMP-forming)/AMP-acid ligase II